MKLFHDEETEGDGEPVRGLPEHLPAGERILWQGRPAVLPLAVHALHIRLVALYFVAATGWRTANLASGGAPTSEIAGAALVSAGAAAASISLLVLIAWAMARSTVYTLTDRRLVFRYGVAIRKYVNLPFAALAGAALKPHRGGAGDVALETSGPGGAGYAHLWPHARPFRFGRPQPTLRAVADAREVAARIAAAVKAFAPADVDVAPRTDDTPAKVAPAAAPAPALG